MGSISPSLDPELLQTILETYRPTRFIETGSGAGHTAALAAGYFRRVDTIELYPDTYQRAYRRLRPFANVVLHLGNSPNVLAQMLPDLREPALFWLDAHWACGPRLAPECPLLEELRAINGTRGRHVILIDDARLFTDAPPAPHDPGQWPTLDEIQRLVTAWQDGSRLAVQDDVIRILPQNDE